MANELDCLNGTPAWLIDELNKIISQQDSYEKFMAKREQAMVASQLGTDRRSMSGLGRVRMEINPKTYHYWGTRLGYACWKDKQFLREMERDNPELRVKCGGTKLQVGYGHLASGGKRKFAKSYG